MREAEPPHPLKLPVDLEPLGLFGTDGPRAVAAAVCSRARELFDADVAVVARLLGASHVVIEARIPATVLMPPGRTFPLTDVPRLADALCERSERPGAPARVSGGRAMRVPVSGGGPGGYVLVLEWPREIPEPGPDLVLGLQRFSDQAGLALERAERLQAEADALGNATQAQRLLTLSASLAAARTVEEVAACLLSEGRRGLGATSARVSVVEAGRLRELASDEPDGITPPADRFRDSDGAVARALGRNLIVLDAASAAVPLSAGAAVVGAVELLFANAREFSRSDREFLAAFGRQGGVALERARLQAAEHSIATRLQRELLPLRLPLLPGLRYAAEYRAGAELMEVGGDWYDVVALDSTRVALTVGDVVGKGVAAAGVMGRLRSALRALALAFDEPEDVIERLERYAATIDGAELATMWYGVLELETGSLRHVGAGHPPVLLVPAGGEAVFLDAGRSAPLCIPLGEPRRQAETELTRETTLLLYSDGLVERRNELLEARLRLLRTQVEELASLPPAELAPALVEAMVEGSPATDDIVVLAVRYEGL